MCLMAYGQTGAGKTHTMQGRGGGGDEEAEAEEGEGPGAQAGLIPRAVRRLLAGAEELERDGWACRVEAGCVEVYNEGVRDLLAEGDRQLAIRLGERGLPQVGSGGKGEWLLVETISCRPVTIRARAQKNANTNTHVRARQK